MNSCKLLVLRLFRLDSSDKNKNQKNGISLADNYERQDTNRTELTTLSNGQIEFQTTSFIRSRSTRARTIEEKNSRLSTPVQTLNSNQGSFKRLRRMTLPGNRLSKYVSGRHLRFYLILRIIKAIIIMLFISKGQFKTASFKVHF